MDYNAKLDFYLQAITAKLKYYIGSIEEKSIVSEAMEYSLMIGGKRIRPVLVLAFCEMLSSEKFDINSALPYACAVEMIHTYSLIHDDLPCMDNDDFRRGQPSCHKKFGEEFALLAGDGLLNLAFEVLFGKFGDVQPAFSFQCGEVLSNASGVEGMIGGQAIDLLSENENISLQKLQKLHNLKTGAMITGACKIGAILGGGSQSDIENACLFGEKIGLCFQVVDDILDKTSSFEKLGKPIGSDESNNKSTYVSLLGLQEAKSFADKLTREALSSIEIYGDKSDFLRKLAAQLLTREK